MFHQILLSGLLLAIGAAFYTVAVRRWLSPLYAKWWLVGLLGLCLAVPLLTPALPYSQQTSDAAQSFDSYTYNQWNVVDINDPSLQACYKEASTSKEVCRCEIAQKAELLVYKPSPWYDFLLRVSSPVFWFLMAMMGLWALDALLKWAFLIYLVRSSPKLRQEYQGTSFYILYPGRYAFPLSSFTLWRHYVIWSPVLEAFSPEEQAAMIAHEVAHLRQRDTWVQFFWKGLGLLWWMHPAYYYVQRELKKLNELVADEWALNASGMSAKQYARILIQAKEYQQKQPAYSFSFAQSLLKKRVLHLLENDKKELVKRNWRRWTGYFSVTALFFCGLVAWLRPSLEQTSIQLHQYQILQQESAQTGQTYFCKDCLLQKLKLQ